MAVENMPAAPTRSRGGGASQAWAGLMHQVGVGVPLELRRTIRARRALSGLRARKV